MRKVIVFGTPVEPVINYLQCLRANAPRLPGLGFTAFAQNGNAQMADLSGTLLVVEHCPELFIVERIIRTGMKLIQVDCIYAERPKGRLQLEPRRVHREIVRAVHEAMKVVAE